MAKSKTARKKSSPPAQKPELWIRMYGQGLGDCFLVRYSGVGFDPVTILIDFGVFLGTSDQEDRMEKVLTDILDELGSEKRIDLLIATHEHWDHLSGFLQTNILDEIQFDRVWLAWTEDPADPLAKKIRADQAAKRQRLHLAINRTLDTIPSLDEAPDPEDRDQVEANRVQAELLKARDVLSFFGPDADPDGNLSASGRSKTTAAAMKKIHKLGKNKCDFLRPGECYRVGSSDLEAYVLGPPQDQKALGLENPRKSKGESYDLLNAVEKYDAIQPLKEIPFNANYAIHASDAIFDPFFRNHYGFPNDPLGDSGAKWRRIDYAWFDGLADLALKLDRGTNNTSLALAFVLPDGRSLIFPGDAQAGNWRSWSDLEFKQGKLAPIQGKQLLNRAIFYKVGHHGSHNATLKAGGLEEMTSGDLASMIPVEDDMVKKKKWKMPAEGIHDRLLELCEGKVLRADQGREQLDESRHAAEALSAGQFDTRQWEAFEGQVSFSRNRVPKQNRPLSITWKLELD